MIRHFKLFRLPVALGRVIGDNSCAYDRMSIVALRLRTEDAWGYSEVQTHGTFTRDAHWIRPLPDLAALKSIFGAQCWPVLRGSVLENLRDVRRLHHSSEPALDAAVRMALWDLQAKQGSVPLYRLFNPKSTANYRRAYGSLRDFPLSDDQVIDVAQSMLSKGITAIKVIVGADDANRDIARLHLSQS